MFQHLIIFLILIQFVDAQRDPSTGWSSIYFSASRSIITGDNNQIGESFDFQSSTGLLISGNLMFNKTNLIGTPLSISNTMSVTLKSNVQNRKTSPNYVTAGIVMDPTHQDIVWAALTSANFPQATFCGVLKANTTTGKTAAVYDLSKFNAPYNFSSLCDDLVVDPSTGYIYVTDLLGYQVTNIFEIRVIIFVL